MIGKTYDVAVIGGGINGAAIACYAARRGFSVALFDKGFCGRQTTAGSSRLIHGGLRYLMYNRDTAEASCVDSGLIIKSVPHLVERRIFALPIFKQERWLTDIYESYFELYDRYQPLKGGKPHVRLSAGDVRGLVPNINRNVVGAITFDEWVVDPVKLVVEHINAAKKMGAQIFEKTRIVGIDYARGLFTVAGRSNDGDLAVTSRTLVNAAGPWADQVGKLLGIRLFLRPTKGVHLVLSGRIGQYGLISRINAGREIIITPLTDTTLVGPTDDDVVINDPDRVLASYGEREVLEQAVERVLPGIFRRHPIIGVTAALRALPNESGPPSKISRDLQIVFHDKEGFPGAVSVFSGKMSEYHLMAARIVNYLGRCLASDDQQNSCYAWRLPTMDDLDLTLLERERIFSLIKDFSPSKRRIIRKVKACADLAVSFFLHWPRKLVGLRRGLATLNVTYDERVSGLKLGEQDCSYYDKWPRLFLEKPDKQPLFIARPNIVSEISRLLALANTWHLSVIPYGAGSGVCGAVVPEDRTAMTIDMGRFDQIEIDSAQQRVIAGAGVIGETLEQALNAHNPPYTLGHFPASMSVSSVGGWLGTRSSGQESTKYGNIDDMTLDLEMVLPDGSVRKFSADEARKMIGSEGTLGVFTRATLRIHPLPKDRYFGAYCPKSFEHGVHILEAIWQSGFRPNVVRLYDASDAALTLKTRHESAISGAKIAALKFASLANRTAVLAECFGVIRPVIVVMTTYEELFRAHKLICDLGARDLGEGLARRWYDSRYYLNEGKLRRLFEAGAFANTLDLAVRWENLHGTYQRIREAIAPYAFAMAHVSHLENELVCLYVTYVGKGRDRLENKALYDAARDAALGACVASGNRIAHHHAIGLEKLRFWKLSDPDRYEELLRLKRLYDPNNIMNPGKLFFAEDLKIKTPI